MNGKWAPLEHYLEQRMIFVRQRNTYEMRFFMNKSNTYSGQLIKSFTKLNKATNNNSRTTPTTISN